MNILVLSPKPPWALGGVERVVKETTLRIAKTREINIEIWCKGSKNEILFWNGIKVRVFKSFFGLSLTLIGELKRAQKEFDVIHIHGTSNLYPLEVLMAIENWSKVVVSSHYHPQGSTLLFRLTKPIYDKFIVSQYLNKAKKIICVSNTEKNILLDTFKLSRDKMRIIYNGIPIEKIKKFRNKRKILHDKVCILYFGRLEKYKNVHILIKSLRYLPESFILTIVGDGSYKRELEYLTKRINLKNRVKFLGVLSEEELYTTLHSCHIIVNLSNIEAFGLMVVESLVANKPVIVNNKLGLRELAEYFTESIVPINEPTPEDVVRAIRMLSSKRKVKVRGLKNFKWERIAKLYYVLYKSELKREGGAE